MSWSSCAMVFNRQDLCPEEASGLTWTKEGRLETDGGRKPP